MMSKSHLFKRKKKSKKKSSTKTNKTQDSMESNQINNYNYKTAHTNSSNKSFLVQSLHKFCQTRQVNSKFFHATTRANLKHNILM